jgi:hypothetical protein
MENEFSLEYLDYEYWSKILQIQNEDSAETISPVDKAND